MLTLFLTITPRDFEIAKTSIISISKLNAYLIKNSILIKIYCNGLNLIQIRSIEKMVECFENVSVENNFDCLDKSVHIGSQYTTRRGRSEWRQGDYESAGDVKEMQLTSCKTEFAGLMDADFEIFDPAFIGKMIECLKMDDNVFVVSTDFNDDSLIYETYSQMECILKKRYHTWFVIYRTSVFKEFDLDLSYHEYLIDGIINKFDHTSWWQNHVLSHSNYIGKSLHEIACIDTENSYIHYGAFAKNRIVSNLEIKFYRWMRLCKHNGLFFMHKNKKISNQIKRFARLLYKLLNFQKRDIERMHYPWQKVNV